MKKTLILILLILSNFLVAQDFFNGQIVYEIVANNNGDSGTVIIDCKGDKLLVTNNVRIIENNEIKIKKNKLLIDVTKQAQYEINDSTKLYKAKSFTFENNSKNFIATYETLNILGFETIKHNINSKEIEAWCSDKLVLYNDSTIPFYYFPYTINNKFILKYTSNINGNYKSIIAKSIENKDFAYNNYLLTNYNNYYDLKFYNFANTITPQNEHDILKGKIIIKNPKVKPKLKTVNNFF